jgi:putative nucleotidyltransferase with HDIG domain
MNRLAYLVVGAVAVLAVVSLGLLPWHSLLELDTTAIFGLLVFIVISIASEATALGTEVGGNKVRSSVSFLPLIALIMVFPAPGAVIAVVVIQIIADLRYTERVHWRLLLNVSQGILVVIISSSTYMFLGGTYAGFSASSVVPTVGLVISFFGANILILSVFFAARQRQPLAKVMKRLVGPAGGNVVYDMLASPFAVVMAVIYHQLYIIGLVLVTMPIILLRASYISKLRSEEAVQDLLRVLVKAIETRDPYTSGHSLRVSTLARVIGEDIGLRGAELDDLERSALLHDIGKVDATYTNIISKPLMLSEEERSVIQTHAEKGAAFLARLASISPRVIAGVRHHHERFDGTGYPDRLAGKDIPLYSRIIMLADSMDAMLSDRPYRAALTPAAVEAELRRHAGAQFDPEVVATILSRKTIERAVGLLGEIHAEVDVMTAVGR